MSEKRIEKKYEKAFAQIGGVQTVFPCEAKIEMAKMVEQVAKTDTNLKSILSTNQGKHIKAGFVAEELHTESFNLDSILKDGKLSAYTDRYPEWHQYGFVKNDTPDIIVADDVNVVHTSQVKYHKNSKATASSMSQIDSKTGRHKYGDQDSLIGPSDQINPEDGSLNINESAKLIEEKFGPKKASLGEAAGNVQNKAAEKLQVEDISSKPIKKNDAVDVAENIDAKPRNDNYEEYLSNSTFKHMKQAAKGAAAISALVSGSFNIMHCCQMVRNGKISEKEAIVKIIAETSTSALDSAIKASSNVGIQSILVRASSPNGTNSIATNLVRKLGARTNIITVGVVCGIDLIKDTVSLSRGNIDIKQFEERTGKNLFNTSSGVVGTTIGTQLGVSLSAYGIFGASVALPLIGGVAGGLIAGLAMQIAMENHIEKPYRELMENTFLLNESMKILEETSKNVFIGQIAFGSFLHEESVLDKALENQMKRNEFSKTRMKSAIDKL